MSKKTQEGDPTQQPDQESNDAAPKAAASRGMPILDLIMRIFALFSSLGSAIAMGKTNQTLPFFSDSFQDQSEYTNIPTFMFFVVANAITSAYLAISLLVSIFHIVKTGAKMTRAVLIISDMAILVLLISGASAATAIVHLAHKGNAQVNWYAICQQYNSFCERVAGCLVGSFLAVLVLVLLISLSAVSLARK